MILIQSRFHSFIHYLFSVGLRIAVKIKTDVAQTGYQGKLDWVILPFGYDRPI